MKPTRSASLLLAAVTVMGALSAQAAARSWTVTRLPAIDAYGAVARAIDAHGTVVGQSWVPSAATPGGVHARAVMWRDGAIVDLSGALGNESVAWSINDRGTITGSVDGKVYVWASDGTPTALPIAGSGEDINRRGDIVGNYWPSGAVGFGPNRAFLWRDGALLDLGALRGPTGTGLYSGAGAINDKGLAVGYSHVYGTPYIHATLWDGVAIKDLGTLDGHNSSAIDVNNRGVIVGISENFGGIPEMVTWDANGVPLQRLGLRMSPQAINDRGAIVGNDADGRAFLREADGTITVLTDLPAMRSQGWTTFFPTGINDHGWIVGAGSRPGSPWTGEALLLKPR